MPVSMFAQGHALLHHLRDERAGTRGDRDDVGTNRWERLLDRPGSDSGIAIQAERMSRQMSRPVPGRPYFAAVAFSVCR
jgi:hypothetical protein